MEHEQIEKEAAQNERTDLHSHLSGRGDAVSFSHGAGQQLPIGRPHLGYGLGCTSQSDRLDANCHFTGQESTSRKVTLIKGRLWNR